MKILIYIIPMLIMYVLGFSLGVVVAVVSDKHIKYLIERVQLCEEKGGKYSLGMDEFTDDYYEKCEAI